MKYLLDTHMVSWLYDRSAENHPKILRKIASLNNDDEVAISILALYELEYGWANAPPEKKEVVRQKIDQAKEDFLVLTLPESGASIFGGLKKQLRERRSITQKVIHRHSVDLILAATCIVGDRTLISSDGIFADLQTIEPKLSLEDWSTLD